jgi:predicted nucleotidyltransferase
MNPADLERLDFLDAAIYGDVFDCAVTFDELWRFARTPVDPADLRTRLVDESLLTRASSNGMDLYCLSDRKELLERRPERARRAELLERRAQRIARVLRHAPFVRGVALTGSAAAGDAGGGDDVDFLIAVAPGRIATAFLFLGPAARVLRRRLGCPNYYVNVRRLAIEPTSVYIEREVAQARVLVGAADLVRSANVWLAESFPNLETSPTDRPLRAGTRRQRVLEAPLRGRLGNRLERWARRIAFERLRVHYRGLGRDVPPDVVESFRLGYALRFHGSGVAERTAKQYTKRRAVVARRLQQRDEELSSPTPAAR